MGKEKSKQRVNVDIGDSKEQHISSICERASGQNFTHTYATALLEALETRKLFQVMNIVGSVIENLTPPLMEGDILKHKLYELTKKIHENEASLDRSSIFGKRKIDTTPMDIGIKTITTTTTTTTAAATDTATDVLQETEKPEEPKHALPFIKIVLRKTKETLLFEQRCTTVLRGSDEAKIVEEDNKFYDYITVGKGRIRRTNDSEAQTTDVLYKSRDANTERIKTRAVDSYVSNFEMFDTYRNLEATTKSIDFSDTQRMDVTTYKVGGVDQFEEISNTRDFKLALMVTLRILAGNVYENEQRRYRNMILPDPLSRTKSFNYALEVLFSFTPPTVGRTRRAVADFNFCPGNGDIVAIAYGIFSFSTLYMVDNGYCGIWNIKNPINPERIFTYNMPVVSVQFSPSTPQLLAIGLYDGSVEVRDITNFNDPPVAISQRTEISTCDPIVAVEWIQQASKSDTTEIDPLLALSNNGAVVKYRIINSPYLLAFQQIQLDRAEGSPEGLFVQRTWNQMQSSRAPQGMHMVLHPRQHDIYYILTDEGCIYKCSTNYPHQHLEVLQVHVGPVTALDFSPWSPKVFLTAGNDWYIRIWLEGIFEPLISLKNDNLPVHTAAWSRTHSTLIISNTRKSISVWDIRRSTLKPVSSTTVDKSYYTLFKFSRCGRSLAIGNERGNLLILGFEDMPFPPHFQYEELELALYRALATNSKLTAELKSIGFFGYPEHRQSRKRQCSSVIKRKSIN